jgi:peptidoglycan/LPS O-acetylase OafA/YrhL
VKGELRALTALRFVFALYALLYHVLFAWNPVVSVHTGGVAAAVLSAGYVSVSGFFVLSGFVLAYAYVDEGRWALRSSVLGFLWARLSRIYPMHIVGVLLSVPLLLSMARAAHVRESAIAAEAWREVAAVGLLVQAWIPRRALDLNGPSWSLSVEAFFYASFPLLVRGLAPLRVRWLLVVAALAYVLAVLPPLAHPLASGIADASDDDRILLFNPLLHLPEFILGVTTGLVFLKKTPTGDRWKGIALLSAVALVVALALSPGFPLGVLHNGLLDPLIAVLIFALAVSWPPSGARSLASPAVLLGRASYSLYILHKPVYLWMAQERRLGRSVPSPGFIALYVGVSLAVSVVLWWAVEEPARRWLRGRDPTQKFGLGIGTDGRPPRRRG